MKIIEMLYKFFNSISAYFQRKLIEKSAVKALPEKTQILEEENIPKEEIVAVDEISLAKRTLITKLYEIEQQMEVFKGEFPNEYSYYLGKIENVRETYNSALEEISRQMTFEIDPELNSQMHVDINRLDKEIKKFIETDVRFDIISKKLEMLNIKLNILYNVSIKHPNQTDKVISQILRALTAEMEIAQEFKASDYVLGDNQQRDRIVTLFSYVDYQNFKTSLRNSNIAPEQMVEKLVLYSQFKDFDYIDAFKAFLEDELSDLGDLVHLISGDQYRKIFEKEILALIKKITYAPDIREHLLDKDFWSRVFELESSLLEFLKGCDGIEEDIIKIKLIDRMKIHVNKSEAITMPKTNAHVALTSVYSITHDERVWLLIKLFKKVSNEITYKEIYFLLQLFDVLEIIQKTNNSLTIHMEKYIKKYPYDSKTILKKKMYVLNSSAEKKYVLAFSLDEDANRIIDALTRLSMDFKVEEGIYINSFYFNGLEKVFPNNTNTTI